MSTLSKTLQFTLNGEAVSAVVPSHLTLVEVLQEKFGLFGARESCGQGMCGCCTVVVDGKAVTACLYPAAFVDGAVVTTIEHSPEGKLDRVQEAFIACGASQCGFCTPGFVQMTRQLLEAHPAPTQEQARHYLSGNLCRCAAYPEILEAVQMAARTQD